MNFLDAQERAERVRLRMRLTIGLAMAWVPVVGLGTALWRRLNLEAAPPLDLAGLWSLALEPLLISLLWLGGMVLVSVIRLYDIRALGGAGLAVQMGGREVTAPTRTLQERQLLNVVEEMGVAASMVPPRVFVLDGQNAPNALSLGRGLDDGVLLVTQGLLHSLERDELQAVVAHEIAHLRQGDAALNTWLLGVFEGVSVFSAPVRFVLGAVLRFRFTETRRTAASEMESFFLMALLIVCLGLWWQAPVLGNMLMASVLSWILVHVARARITRGMEYRADAVAVQLTRHPRSLATALSKVASLYEEAANDSMPDAGHMLFMRTHANSHWGALTATHPTSEDRIRRLAPEVLSERSGHNADADALAARTRSLGFNSLAFSGRAVAEEDEPFVDEPEAETAALVPLNTMVLLSLSPDLRQRLREGEGARLALLAVIHSQLGLKTGLAPDDNPFLEVCHSWDDVAYLPLLDVSLSVLRSEPLDKRLALLAEVDRLMQSVPSPGLVGYALRRIVLGALEEPTEKPVVDVERTPRKSEEYIALLLTLAVRLQPATPAEQTAAFAAAMAKAPEAGRWTMRTGPISAMQMDAALKHLATESATYRRRIVEAVEQAVMHDDQLTAREEIWLRAVYQALHC